MLAERLLLAIYAYGTNAGIRGGDSATTGTARTTCATHAAGTSTVPACRDRGIAHRQRHLRRPQARLWGEGSTAVASDSTHLPAFDQNIFTEWHSRYGAELEYARVRGA